MPIFLKFPTFQRMAYESFTNSFSIAKITRFGQVIFEEKSPNGQFGRFAPLEFWVLGLGLGAARMVLTR